MFSTLAPEQSAQCGGGGALAAISRTSIEYVEPQAAAAFTGQAFAVRAAYCEAWGNGGAGGLFNPNLFGGLDAVLRPRDMAGNVLPSNMRTVFVSPAVTTPNACLPTFRDGDVGRLLPPALGVLELFISEPQIKAAFCIPMMQQINVDAIAFDMKGNAPGIYLSFELQQVICGGVVVNDGAILHIPLGALGLAASPYDGAALVNAVAAGSGMLLHTEAAVSAMVAGSGTGDAAGVAFGLVGDTDGLAIGAQGSLWFSGQNLTGGAVLTTAGVAAVLNGVPLAGAVTTGAAVGLVGMAVGSLNGLTIIGAGCTVAIDAVQNPCAAGVVPINLEVGGAGAPVVWLLAVQPTNCMPDAPIFAFPNPCFPELYALNPIVAGAGCANLALIAPCVPGWHVVAQAATILGGVPVLSAPIAIDL